MGAWRVLLSFDGILRKPIDAVLWGLHEREGS